VRALVEKQGLADDRFQAIHAEGFGDQECGLRRFAVEKAFRIGSQEDARRRQVTENFNDGLDPGAAVRELNVGMRFATRRQAKDEVMDWLMFYNGKRLHSTLGYLSPMAFEKKRLGEERRLVA
jgi:transposase InsO family protein